MAPYPKTVEPYFSAANQIDERYHHKLSCQPTSPDLCTVCPQAGKIPCPGCRLVKYCSEKCLEKDRPIHELFCKSFELVSAGKRPIALDICFFRAIFIPENGKPRWTWVKTTSDRLFYCLEHLYNERAEYEKLFKQAEKPVVFGYIPQDRPIFMSMASLLLEQEFERWSANNFWQR